MRYSASSENRPGMPQSAAAPTTVNTIRDQMELLPPSSQPTKSNWNRPTSPVNAADDHENQTDFIKGLHKKTLPSLGIAFPEKGGFMHSETLTAAIWG